MKTIGRPKLPVSKIFIEAGLAKVEVFGKKGVVDYALVDSDDSFLVGQHRWRLGNRGHAQTLVGKKTLLMHHLIHSAPVDHINRNPLDNRKQNLRPGPPLLNSWNIGPFKTGKIPFKGVSLSSQGSYRCLIKVEGIKHSLGGYRTAEDAAKVFDIAATILQGEYAYLNFPGQPWDITAIERGSLVSKPCETLGCSNWVKRFGFCKKCSNRHWRTKKRQEARNINDK